MDNDKLNKLIDERIKEHYKTSSFTQRKVTDTPTDDLMIVNRKYVNMYGTTAQRPVSSVIGQQYFDTDLGYPIYKNQNYKWVNSVASVVG